MSKPWWDRPLYRFWSWLDDSWPSILAISLLLLVVGGGTYGVVYSIRYENAVRRDCLGAGYDAAEYLDSFNRWGCLDVRDGEYVVVPIEKVRAER